MSRVAAQPSLFESLLGADFESLAPAVRRFHSSRASVPFRGEVQTAAPETPLARLMALCLGSPRHASRGTICFELQVSIRCETWTRHFPHRTMRSRLCRDGGLLVERLGAARLGFKLAVEQGMLVMQLRTLHVMGLRCPAWLMPEVHAVERGDDGLLHFDVSASWPWTGTIAAYSGYLALPPAGADA